MSIMSPMMAIKSAREFGKYEGQSDMAVLADCVPRHNSIQARFLDTEFRMKTVMLSCFDFLFDKPWYSKHMLKASLDFEVAGWNVSLTVPAETIWYESDELVLAPTCISASVFVEIVVDVGNEYPLLLRLLKEQAERVGVDNKFTHAVLVYDTFIADGITEEQFVAMFQACGFIVLKVCDIESAPSVNEDQHLARSVGYISGEQGRTEDKAYYIDVPCRYGGVAHVKMTLGRTPISLKFDDAACKDCCCVCQELSSYCLLCHGSCHRE